MAAVFTSTICPRPASTQRHRFSRTQVRATSEPSPSPSPAPPASCPTCGVARDKMTCDGSGRQQGGIGAVPGFKWWPIKAFRPCPALIESGGTYTKKGQDIDEVLFGKNSPMRISVLPKGGASLTHGSSIGASAARRVVPCTPGATRHEDLKRLTVAMAAKGAAKAAKEPKAPKAASKKGQEEVLLAAAAAGEQQHVTPNLGLVVTVSVLPDSRRRLLTQIPVNVLKTSYDAVLQELGEGATLPGFRKGASAPAQVLVAAVGAGKFRAACVEHLLQATLEEIMFPVKSAAFQDSERIVTPVADMSACFSGASCAPATPLVLSVECDVLPTVSWAKPYERLAIRVPAPSSDAAIASDAEKMLQQKLRDCGELRVVADGRGIQRSDVARLNVSAAHKKPDGSPGDLIMSMQHRNLFYDTEAEGTNLPGFDDAVAGMKASETRSFQLTFPPEWATETLRGVTALFTVHCSEHFCRTLPPLDDAVAPRLREGCTDLAAARAAFLADARARALAEQEETKRVAVLDELARCTSVEVPQSLLDETGRQLYSARLLDLQAKGQLSPVAMRQMMADSLIEQYFKHNRDDIRSKVVAQLAIIDVARRERLEASPEAVAAEVARGKAEFKRFGQECDEDRLTEQAQEGLLSQAVIDWLVDRADVTHA